MKNLISMCLAYEQFELFGVVVASFAQREQFLRVNLKQNSVGSIKDRGIKFRNIPLLNL